MRAAIFVAAVIALGPICQAGNVEQEASEKARKMVARFEAGDLSEGFDIFGVRDGDGPKIGSGPGITIDPTGRFENMPVVALNGQDLGDLGREAFPEAFALLDHPYQYMRIVGSAALHRITGVDGKWDYYRSPWLEDGGQTAWAKNAKRLWMSWYLKQLGEDDAEGKPSMPNKPALDNP